MIHGSVANTLVLCVGLPLKEVAKLARTVGQGTLVMAAGDVDTAWRLLGSAEAQGAAAEQEPGAPGAPGASAAPAASAVAAGTPPRVDLEPAPIDPLRVGLLTIDPPAREVLCDDRPVRLSAREFDLLTLLASDLHLVWPFASLVKSLWRTDYLGDHDQLASTVKRLRKRLGPDTGCEVHSVHGVGYRLVVTEEAVA